jgi:hypothetical protein
LGLFLRHEDGVGLSAAARTEPGLEKPAVLKLTVDRILKVGDDGDQDAVREDEAPGFASVAVDGHGDELTSDGRGHVRPFTTATHRSALTCVNRAVAVR